MPKITYIEHDGTAHTVEATVGDTVMETALRHSVPGIVAECGGGCSCATCLVHVAEEWLERVVRATPRRRTSSTSPSTCGRTRGCPARSR